MDQNKKAEMFGLAHKKSVKLLGLAYVKLG
jgi:hypothetical protein